MNLKKDFRISIDRKDIKVAIFLLFFIISTLINGYIVLQMSYLSYPNEALKIGSAIVGSNLATLFLLYLFYMVLGGRSK